MAFPPPRFLGSFTRFVAAATLALTGLGSAAPATALDVRLITDNDFLAENERSDDLYTFALALELEGPGATWTLRENAFTDRQAGLRFDETAVTLGRLAPAGWLGSWSAWGELGVLHVGEGLLGESVQNSFHELIGDDPVHLDYLDRSDLHAFLALELDRQWIVRPRLSLGPHVAVTSAPGFKSDALLAVRGRWFSRGGVQVDFTVGPRLAQTGLAVLEPHLESVALAASVEATLWKGLVVQWTKNRYGTGNEHFGLGVRIGAGRGQKRAGPWLESGAR